MSDGSQLPEAEANVATGARNTHVTSIAAQAQAEVKAHHAAVAAAVQEEEVDARRIYSGYSSLQAAKKASSIPQFLLNFTSKCT